MNTHIIRTASVLGLAGILTLASCDRFDYKKTKGGLPYKIFAGSGKLKSVPGSFLKLNYTYKLEDSLLSTSYGKTPAYIPVPPQSTPYDISELFVGRVKGDSIVAVQKVDSIIAKVPQGLPPAFKPGKNVYITMKVEEVYPDEKASMADQDKAQKAMVEGDAVKLQKYLSDNHINATKTGQGTYVQVLEPGNGPALGAGKTAVVLYRGTLMNGKEFDSNFDTVTTKKPPLEVALGAGQTIPGFDEGLQALHVGDHAKLYLPAALAYGPNGNPPVIPPNSPLVFEIKVLGIK